MLNPIFPKKVQRQKHPGRWGIIEHQIPSIKMFKTNTKSHKHPRIRFLSKGKTQLVNQKQKMLSIPKKYPDKHVRSFYSGYYYRLYILRMKRHVNTLRPGQRPLLPWFPSRSSVLIYMYIYIYICMYIPYMSSVIGRIYNGLPPSLIQYWRSCTPSRSIGECAVPGLNATFVFFGLLILYFSTVFIL